MTRFENRGVMKQYEARTKEYADKFFDYSCKICCEMRGMRIPCDRCAISFAHDEVVAIFEDRELDSRRNEVKQHTGKNKNKQSAIA